MPSVLIIGASQGLGLEWVKYYKKQAYTVIATTRDINSASAIELKKLLSEGDKLLKLDAASDDSVTSAMHQLQEAPEITIYNAGVKGYTKSPETKPTLLNSQLTTGNDSSRSAGRQLAMEVNANGLDRILYALKDKLLQKPNSAVVYISTGVANNNTGGGYPFYRQTKAAGEAFARGWDVDLREASRLVSFPRIFSIIPGLVNAGMGKGIGDAADPEKRIAEMAAVIEHVISTGDTHGVWSYDRTKVVEYPLPDCVTKESKTDAKSAAKLSASMGIYKTKIPCVDQGVQTDDLSKRIDTGNEIETIININASI